MAFTSYEELRAAVQKRREEILTLEVDLGTAYSPEYEAAKQELANAKAMKTMTGGGFLGDTIAPLEQRVAELKPEPNSIFIQYKKLDLGEWAALMKQVGGNPVDQYEKVLPKTFVGLYGVDPVEPEDWAAAHPGEDWIKPAPLTEEAISVSTLGGDQAVLPGPSLHSVVQNFMAWQNSSGDVNIRPTKSGLA